MGKRFLVSFAVLMILLGALGWLNRIDLLLALVKFQSEREFDIAPYREVPWQAGPAVAEAGERPPNIILILADDLGYNDISTFGGGIAGGRLQTPNIDQLAADGAIFEQAYAGNATCAPSRAMIMTGRYPTRTGFEFTPTPTGMGPAVSLIMNSMDSGLPPAYFNQAEAEAALPYQSQGLPTSEVTIAEVLKQRGYYTAHIGKWHLGRGEGFTPNDQGFDDSLLMASGLYLPEGDPQVVNAKLDFDPIDQFLWARLGYAAAFNNDGAERFEPSGYLTDYWTDEAVKVIQQNKHGPFFLYLAHWGLHTPLQATREDYEAVGDIKPHRLRVYAAMMRALDRSVGAITKALEAEGLADNTIVMFSSDNGGAGYIGLPEVNAPFRGWKLTNFEGGLRVPMFLKWPGIIAPGTTVSEPVAHIDLMPTLAAAAQAPLPKNVAIDGYDLLPLATNTAGPVRDRGALFWQSGYYRVVRQGDWKLQVSDKLNKVWLYNLADDPTEQTNLAGVAVEKLTVLQALLAAHKASAREPLYPFLAELPVAVDKSLAERFEAGDEYIYWPN
ncbi:MAG: sulfatase-like hydrolase/transferase [Pseudomonadales bacterium]|jgi:arylsulfatase A-like enzyme|tara:strand:- start:5790 stop:7457 length:1668 start_codon:yes stop_codon:yes gene_type:complete